MGLEKGITFAIPNDEEKRWETEGIVERGNWSLKIMNRGSGDKRISLSTGVRIDVN